MSRRNPPGQLSLWDEPPPLALRPKPVTEPSPPKLTPRTADPWVIEAEQAAAWLHAKLLPAGTGRDWARRCWDFRAALVDALARHRASAAPAKPIYTIRPNAIHPVISAAAGIIGVMAELRGADWVREGVILTLDPGRVEAYTGSQRLVIWEAQA